MQHSVSPTHVSMLSTSYATPTWYTTSSKHSVSLEDILGTINMICFIVGIPLTLITIAFFLSKQRSLINVTIAVLSIDFLVRVFLDLHTSMSLFIEHRLFSSYHFSNLWGYVDCVTDIWSWELVGILALGSFVSPSRRVVAALGIVSLLYAMFIEAIPVIYGLTYKYFSQFVKPMRYGYHSFPGGLTGIIYYQFFALGVPYFACIFFMVASLIVHLVRSSGCCNIAKRLRILHLNVFKKSVPYRGFVEEEEEEENAVVDQHHGTHPGTRPGTRSPQSSITDHDVRIVVGVLAIYLLFEVPRIVLNSIFVGYSVLRLASASYQLHDLRDKIINIWYIGNSLRCVVIPLFVFLYEWITGDLKRYLLPVVRNVRSNLSSTRKVLMWRFGFHSVVEEYPLAPNDDIDV